MDLIKKVFNNKSDRYILARVLGVGLIYVLILFITIPLLQDINIFDNLLGNRPHSVQLEYSIFLFFGPFTVLLISLLILLRKDQKITLRKEDGRFFRFTIYFILLAILTHWMTWWVIKPGCVGCMSDDGLYSMGVLFLIFSILLSSIIILSIIYLTTRSSHVAIIVKETVLFFIFYNIVMSAMPIYPFFMVLFSLGLIHEFFTGNIDSFSVFWEMFIEIS